MSPELMEFQSRSRLNRDPLQQQFYLSDVPFESLRNLSPFFKSATGKIGRIVRVDGSYKGADPEVLLSIQWDNVEELSFVVWPDECTKLPVDMSVVGKYLQPYCETQIGRLLKQVAFYTLVSDGNPHRLGSLEHATFITPGSMDKIKHLDLEESSTGNDNVVEETAVKVIPTA
jgi:hypothetical protein